MSTAQNWNFPHKLIFTLLALIVSIWLVVRLTDVAILLAVAVLLAAIMQPPITWLARRSVPRGVAVLLIYLILFGLLALCIYLLTPIFASQLAQLASDSWYSRLQQWTNQWQARSEQTPGLTLLGELPAQLGALVQTWMGELGRWAVSLGNLLLDGVLVLAIAYFLAVDPNSPRRLLFDLLPEPYHQRAYHWSGLMGEQVVRWAWSQGLLSLYIVVVYGLGLYVLGVPNALLLAVVGGFLEVIPYLGGVVTASAAVLLSLPYSVPTALGAVAWYVIVNLIENYVLIPRLYQRTLRLHPLLVLIAFIVGERLLGLIGMLLSIPLAAALQAAWEHRDRVVIQPGVEAENAARDPVCGMRLAPELAHSSLTYRGETYYFCSERCHKVFVTWPVDPVCHQKVMPAVAEQITYQGKTYYFCNPECRRRFAEAPASWLDGNATDPT